MSNEFDLERARAGEPVESWHPNGWMPVRFIGVWSDNEAVCEVSGWNLPKIVPFVQLRMAPKKVQVRYRNYMLSDIVHSSVGVLVDKFGGDTPEDLEKRPWFRGWIHTEWQETEVTE